MRRALIALALVAASVVGISCPGSAGERVDVTALDGVQLIGELSGTVGPGVVLTRGGDEKHERWTAVAPAIAARGFRVLALDLRGQGASSGAADLADADRDIEGAYRYLLARKIRPVFLVATAATASASHVVGSRVPTAGVLTLTSDSDESIDSLVTSLRASPEPK
jgi:pimeloyl-ACP methyl ester carboxylesterase